MKLINGGGEACWADSKITSLTTEDENKIKMFDLTPNSIIFKDLMKNTKLGDKTNDQIVSMIDKLLSIVKCNAFQNVKKIILSENNLNDDHFNLIKEKLIIFLKNSNIEIIDVRNNNITEKTIEDFNNLNVNNVNNNNITMLSGETGAISNENNAISNENNVNDTWQDSNKNEEKVSLFIPESLLDRLSRLIVDKNDRKSILNNLIANSKEITIESNLKEEEVKLPSIETKTPPESTKLLGIGWLGLGGGNEIKTSGVKIIIPKTTIYSFLEMSSDKNNRIKNINNFITSLNDIYFENNILERDKINYLRNIKQLYRKGGYNKTNKTKKTKKTKKTNKTNKNKFQKKSQNSSRKNRIKNKTPNTSHS
jgi:hypothetical protein